MHTILTFRLGSSLYGIDIDYIKWIVDIEQIHEAEMMPPFIVGEIAHSDRLYFLLCLQRLFDTNASCTTDNKNAIILKFGEKEFAILVDEIEKIEEIATKDYENEKVEIVRHDNEVVEILKKEFFDSLQIPVIKPLGIQEDTRQTIQDNEKSFLLFWIGEELFAIEASEILFVEVYEDAQKGAYIPTEEFIEGIYLVKHKITYLLNLAKYLQLPASSIQNILMLQYQNDYLGIGVGEVVNIVPIQESALDFSKATDRICCFFPYEGKIVSVLSNQHLHHLVQKYGVLSSDKKELFKQNISTPTKEFLIVSIGDKSLALDMENIQEIHEIEDIHISRSIDRAPGVAGMVTIENRSYLLFDLAQLLQSNTQTSDSSLILISDTKENGQTFTYALRIDEIRQILDIPVHNIHLLESSTPHFIGASFNYNDTVYNVLNPSWVISTIKEERAKG